MSVGGWEGRRKRHSSPKPGDFKAKHDSVCAQQLNYYKGLWGEFKYSDKVQYNLYIYQGSIKPRYQVQYNLYSGFNTTFISGFNTTYL